MSRAGQGQRAPRRRAFAVAFAAAAVSALALTPAANAARGQPNIVVISTDDQALSWFSKETMPQTWRQIVAKGTRFANAIAPTPLCCPSRAAFLTGQYGHNNGVLRNRYGDLREPDNVLPVWLQNAGYETAHVGKWLNDYERGTGNGAKPAPGWDHWRTAIGNPTYYDARFSVDGQVKRFGREPRDLITKRIGLYSRRMVRKLASQPQPFYLQIDEYAPHGDNHFHAVKQCPGRTPEPSAEKFELYRKAKMPTKRGFNERDVSDKPAWVQAIKPITQATRTWLRLRYRCALAAVRTADSQIGKLLKEIKAAGIAGETIVIFWSDNGYLSGEHRMVGKARPYDQALRVPLAIRVPRAVAGRRTAKVVDEPVANIDLAPTILRYARAQPCAAADRCRLIDGRSLAALIRGRRPAWPEPRLLLVEKDRGDDGALPQEPIPELPVPVVGDGNEPQPEPPDERLPNGSACTFKGIWTPRLTYSVYTSVWDKEQRCVPSWQVEIYDKRYDPWQLDSLPPHVAGFPRPMLGGSTLEAELQRLDQCAGNAPVLPNPCD